MSSNRLIYDTCAYKEQLGESTSQLGYSLYPGKFENCSKCRIELGQVGGNGVSLFSGNLVDLESDLRGQSRAASLCSSNHFTPDCKDCKNCGTGGLPCGCLKCRSKNLVNQPSCQMVNYKPVPQPNKVNVPSCPQFTK